MSQKAKALVIGNLKEFGILHIYICVLQLFSLISLDEFYFYIIFSQLKVPEM